MSLLVLLIALLSPVKGYYAPTASMHPAIVIESRLFANRFVWGFGPHTFDIGLPLGARILVDETPRRGVIAVFYNVGVGLQ
jgi:hypothetical protein